MTSSELYSLIYISPEIHCHRNTQQREFNVDDYNEFSINEINVYVQ